MSIDCKHYGAVGDNSTDDTCALQNWLNVLQEIGGTGVLSAGHYKTGPLVITRPLHITGGGAVLDLIQGSTGQLHMMEQITHLALETLLYPSKA